MIEAVLGLGASLAATLWVMAGEEARDPRRARPRSQGPRRCPYCHEELRGEAERERCPACRTIHHAACWAEHGGCSVFACLREGPIVRSEGAPAAPAPDAGDPADPGPPERGVKGAGG